MTTIHPSHVSPRADIQNRHLLLVEDNPGDADFVEELLDLSTRYRYEVLRVERLNEAVSHLALNTVDVVLLDLRLPDAVGTPAVQAVRGVSGDVPILVLTGTEDEDLALSCIDAGADDYLFKGDVQAPSLQRAIGYAISRRKLERQFQAAQRMEAVGTLAGGVAHDFNNLLTAIFGYADAAIGKLADDHPARADMASVVTVAERAASLTRQLLAFSRQQVMDPRVVNLNDVMEGTGKILARLLPANVKLVTSMAPELANVFADSVQIEQIVMNLVVNARDAMPEGGTVTVETYNVQLGEEYVGRRPSVPPGQYAVLSVSDTGMGMDEETQARIFEPFFTTKEVGSGTGLGLATVYGIVKQSQGYVWVYSEVGCGTTLRIYFPRTELDREAPMVVEERRPTRGDETVLFVEDDEAVRQAGASGLESQGYHVLIATNGLDALQLESAYDGGIDMLVTDVVMPVMGGKDLAREFRLRRPNAMILFTSGYARQALEHREIASSEIGFLNKPYTPTALARKVREILDRRPADAD